MRVLMLAPGTRGDVAPFAGLGARMRGAGHDVVIVADAPYAQLAQDAGCAFHPVPADLREVISGARQQSPLALETPRRSESADVDDNRFLGGPGDHDDRLGIR
jgi:UDP:flavonoid glycosyltransferase YjiC (YdhE family)